VLYPLSYGGSRRPQASSVRASFHNHRLIGGQADSVAAMIHDPPRVLVVDDIADIRALIAINLELEGFDVRTAESGKECIAMVEVIQPDVITLDVAMPDLDGFSTAALLRARPSTADIPLVMVTARAQGFDLARGAEIGVDAYVTKPFDPAELVRTVRKLVMEKGGQPRR
jgi:DNA-binding response OmpR family regulator